MMDEQALFDEMMSQPLTEDEREMVDDHLMQQAALQRDRRIAALEAELTTAQAAHAKAHEEAADWRRLYTEKMTKVAELELAFSACEDTATEARFAQEQAEAERDAARAAAKRYKRRAHLLYRTWCGYWGTPVDWDFLRTALYDPEVRDE